MSVMGCDRSATTANVQELSTNDDMVSLVRFAALVFVMVSFHVFVKSECIVLLQDLSGFVLSVEACSFYNRLLIQTTKRIWIRGKIIIITCYYALV